MKNWATIEQAEYVVGGDAGHLAEEDLNSAEANVLANETEK